MVLPSAQSAQSILMAEQDTASETVVDLSVLTSFEEIQVEGEPDLIVELIDLYLEDAPRQMALMQKADAETDEKMLKRAAHSLKGSSANLGVRGIAALCAEIERADCGDSFQKATLLVAGMEQEFERVRQVLMIERQRRL